MMQFYKINMNMNHSRYLKIYKKLKSISGRCFYATAAEAVVKPTHIPVMKHEVLEHLNVNDGDTVLDMTYGSGGHSKALLEKYSNLNIIALDRDPVAYEYARELESEKPNQIIPILGKFSELYEKSKIHGIQLGSVDGVICDLGASSMQMDVAERGFALSKTGPLDMRMDGNRDPDSITAADVVNYASEQELFKIFRLYGEEKYARSIARAMVQARATYQKFRTTKDVADLVSLICNKPGYDKIGRRTHNATKVFQALRIFVNNELNELNHGLILANLLLKVGGRIVVLSFHSLEDSLVKSHFQGHVFDNASQSNMPWLPKFKLNVDKHVDKFINAPWKPVNKKVIVPEEQEVILNPRSRSAKLRAAEKLRNL